MRNKECKFLKKKKKSISQNEVERHQAFLLEAPLLLNCDLGQPRFDQPLEPAAVGVSLQGLASLWQTLP